MKVLWWLSFLGSATALLFAPATLVPYSSHWIMAGKKWRPAVVWLWVWMPLLMLGLWRLAFHDGWWLVGAAAIGALYSIVVVPTAVRPVVLGLATALILFVVCAGITTQVARSAWHSYSYPNNELRAALDSLRGVHLLAARDRDAAFGQLWEIPPGASDVTIILDLKAVNATPGPVKVSLTSPGRPDSASLSASTEPSTSWSRYTWTFTIEPSDQATRHTVVLRVGAGHAVESRNLQVSTSSPTAPRRLAFEPRAKLWYNDSNIAGHSAAMAGLVALSLPTTAATSVVLLLAGGAAVALTGSRTALLALILGGIALIALRGGSRLFLTLLSFIAAALLGALALVRPEVVQSMTHLVFDTNSVSRQEIWQFAIGLIKDRPWQGWGPTGFLQQWQLNHFGAVSGQVTHAHNLLLEFFVAYGLLGGLTALLLAYGLLRVARLKRGMPGAIIVGATVLLNVFDYTLFNSGVIAILVLGINAPTGSTMAHNEL